MTIDWQKVRWFVHRRCLYCTAAVLEDGEIRLFPIGSLRVGPRGDARYFEIFARPVPEGAPITFLAVDVNPLFWLASLLRGRFTHPPALRLRGTLGPRRQSTEDERQGWLRRVGWLIKTRGGQRLWSRPDRVRELSLHRVEPVRVSSMTRHLKDWPTPGLAASPENAAC